MRRATLIVCFHCLLAMSVYAAPPSICRIQGGNTKTIWGTGFDSVQTEVYIWNIPYDETEIIQALYRKPGMPCSLPLRPPGDAKRLNILSVDASGLVMAVAFSADYEGEAFYDGRISGQAIWIKNRDGFSAASIVQKIDPWWLYPQKIRPGERLRIFGRNLEARLMALKSMDPSGKIRVIKPDDHVLFVRNKLYENELVVPRDLLPGKYQLVLHNGAGGSEGWSRPLVVEVLATQEVKTRYYEAAKFQVKGDGITDDTKRLKSVIAMAAPTGGTILLKPGRFLISETLKLPPGVSLAGAGRGATTLEVSGEGPAKRGFPPEAVLEDYANDWLPSLRKDYFPMIWLRDSSSITDMTLQFGPGVFIGILVARCPGIAANVKIERVTIQNNQKAPGWIPSTCVLIASNTYGLVISDNEFTGGAGIDAIANMHMQAYIGRNKAVTIPSGSANTIFLRGMRESIVENNHAAYGCRTFSAQGSARKGKYQNTNGDPDPGMSSYHVAVMGNIFEKNLTWRHNDGECMYESGSAYWRGKAKAVIKNGLTVEGRPFLGDMTDCYLLVLSGRGLGQYRRITSYTDDQLVLDRDWDIAPDSSTYFVAGAFFAEHLWIDNTIDDNISWVGFWGNNLGHVVDGAMMRDCGDLTLWAWDKTTPSTVAFVDIIGSRNIGKGTIVFRGSPVFGNTIRMCEVVDFRYRPDFHIDPVWLRGIDPNDRVAITIKDCIVFKGVPAAASLNSWNIIEANHLYNGPNGIRTEQQIGHTIIRKNFIYVDKEKIKSNSGTNYIEY